jgi:hypothetical protein
LLLSGSLTVVGRHTFGEGAPTRWTISHVRRFGTDGATPFVSVGVVRRGGGAAAPNWASEPEVSPELTRVTAVATTLAGERKDERLSYAFEVDRSRGDVRIRVDGRVVAWPGLSHIDEYAPIAVAEYGAEAFSVTIATDPEDAIDVVVPVVRLKK